MFWGDKPYHSLDWELKNTFGEKVYKISLDIGCTCPNRDGTISTGGCIFCSAGGSGDFAQKNQNESIYNQIEKAKSRIRAKTNARKFIAYFQSFTNTYGDMNKILSYFNEAINHPDILAISIGTRPDCLSDEWIENLTILNKIKPVWIELGLQTMHESTATFIRRGYPLSVFEDTYRRLKKNNLTVIVHIILGLPGESESMMTETVRYLCDLTPRPDGIKLQLLHILKGTDLADIYVKDNLVTLDKNQYIDICIDLISQIPQDIVIHRITGDGPKRDLIAPLWSADKKDVLNSFTKRFKEKGIFQGIALKP